MRDLRIRASRLDLLHRIDLLAAIISPTGKIDLAQPLVFSPAGEGDMFPGFLRLTIEEAQAFMDSLWECGLRPTEGTGSAGSLKATENHLQDMRRLVFEGRRPR